MLIKISKIIIHSTATKAALFFRSKSRFVYTNKSKIFLTPQIIMIKDIKILIFIEFMFLATSSYSNNFTKPKVNLVGRDTNTGEIIRDPDTKYIRLYNILDLISIDNRPNSWNEFFISFDSHIKYKILRAGIEKPLLERTDSNMLMRLPFISPYGFLPQSNSIYFKERLALIILTPDILAKMIPALVKTTISNKFNIDSDDLISKLKNIKTSLNAVILGNYLKYGPTIIATNPTDAIFNLRYHYWAALSHNLKQAQDLDDPYKVFMSKLDFNDPIDMGLFIPDGISYVAENQSNSMAFDQLKTQNVYWHNALSPNNARFKIDMNRNLSSFWAIAISPNKEHINITYFLIANSQAMKSLLADILSNANNIEQLKLAIAQLASNKPDWLSSKDLETLKMWINTIVNAVTDSKTINLQEAKDLLLNLTSTLYALSSHH